MNEQQPITEEQKQQTILMAQQLHSAAIVAWEVNRSHQEFLGETVPPSWPEASEEEKQMAISGASRVVQNPEMTPQQNHSLFCAHLKAEGWVHGPYNREGKTHPLLTKYEDIPEHDRLKDVLFATVVKTIMGLGFKPAGG